MSDKNRVSHSSAKSYSQALYELASEEKKLNDVISSLPSGVLVFYEGTDLYKLSNEQYEAVCKITKLIPQGAIMAAHFLKHKAYELYIS